MSFDGSFAVWLQEQSGQPPLPAIVSLVRKAAAALQSLHNQHIVHQNVNPNSFHAQIDDSGQFKLELTDQGTSARALSIFGRSSPANSQPLYMAPEQWMGQASPATDQYALAVQTYQLLTGQAPFQGSPAQLMDSHLNVRPPVPSTLNQRVTPAIDTVILNALAKRPEDRFPSIMAFAHALEVAVYHPEALIVSVPRTPVEGSLRANLYISNLEAEFGTLRTITLADGKRITVSIPEKTNNGQTLRLEGLGDTGTGRSMSTVVLTISIAPAETRPLVALAVKHNTDEQQKSSPHMPPPPSGSLLATERSSSGVMPAVMAANVTPVLTPMLTPLHSVQPKVTKPLTSHITSSISSGLNRSKTLAEKGYTTIATLPPARRIAFLTCVAFAILLVLISLIALAVTHIKVPIAYAPNSGTLALSDALHDSSNGNNWPESISKDGSFCQFTHGAYHVGITQAGASHYCVAGATGYDNFAYEAHMKILRGDRGGLIFRADGANSKFYYFRIGRDGSYGLYLYVDTVGTHAQTLANGVTPALHTGLNIDNLIAVVAHGSVIDLYANNQLITTVTNGAYGSGQFGLAAAYSTEATDVAYSDVKIWTL